MESWMKMPQSPCLPDTAHQPLCFLGRGWVGGGAAACCLTYQVVCPKKQSDALTSVESARGAPHRGIGATLWTDLD